MIQNTQATRIKVIMAISKQARRVVVVAVVVVVRVVIRKKWHDKEPHHCRGLRVTLDKYEGNYEVVKSDQQH